MSAELLPVIQADREAAALVFDIRARRVAHPATITMERHHAKVVRAGEGDDYDAVQAAAMARTRLTSTTPTLGDMVQPRLALEAIKAVTATTNDAVAGLSRIMAITRSAGVDAPYSDLMAKPDVALIVNRKRALWRHLFERPKACAIPPEGWTCSRAPGHDGPCAASPIPTSVNGAGEREALRMSPEWCLRMAEREAEHGGEIGAGTIDHPLRLKCERAAPGWTCTRQPGHDGPCAAIALSPALDNTAGEGRS